MLLTDLSGTNVESWKTVSSDVDQRQLRDLETILLRQFRPDQPHRPGHCLESHHSEHNGARYMKNEHNWGGGALNFYNLKLNRRFNITD